MTDPTALRDQLIDRLTQEFGDPTSRVSNFRWSIRCGRAHPPVNLALDGCHTPESIRLWIFDPSAGEEGVQYFVIANAEGIDSAILQIQRHISRYHRS